MNYLFSNIHIIGTGVFALLAIMNPFGNLPVFISMNDDLTHSQRARLLRHCVYVACVIVVIFAFVGTFIMKYFFQVELSELRIAGGLILVMMGVKNLLFPQEVKKHDISDYNVSDDEAEQRIIPIAFPMLVGPGTLATVIVLDSTSGLPLTLTMIFITFVIIFILFMLTDYIEKLVSKIALYVLSRIMQVFIMAVGVKMFEVGLRELIKWN